MESVDTEMEPVGREIESEDKEIETVEKLMEGSLENKKENNDVNIESYIEGNVTVINTTKTDNLSDDKIEEYTKEFIESDNWLSHMVNQKAFKDNYIFKNDKLGRGYYREKMKTLIKKDEETELDIFLNKFRLFWQYPVITEETFYNQNYKNEYYFGFPWATIIDRRYDLNLIYILIKKNLDFDPNKEYYTCVQHISFRNIIPLLEKLNIKKIYTPHKIINEDKINSILINPCPLYAVNYEDEYRNKLFRDDSALVYKISEYDIIHYKRTLLYSFIGAYNPRDYLTDIRNKIFEMKHPDDCLIEKKDKWHFDPIVYSKLQNFSKDYYDQISSDLFVDTNQYNLTLLNSRFSLCPSGSGPNSIRFWESLAIGSIPILLADTLELPQHELWEKAILRIPEKDLETVPIVLENITNDEENSMRENCLKIYDDFRNNYVNSKDENKKD